MATSELELLQARLAQLEQALLAIDARLNRLEGRGRVDVAQTLLSVHAQAGVPVPHRSPPSVIDITLIGKSVLIVGGAYLLRALTELKVIPDAAGMLLAFLYAMVWIWMADRADAAGRRTAALFHAGTVAAIAGPLIWEATTRFHMLTPPAASALLVLVAFGFLWVAWRRNASSFALIGAIVAAVTATGLAIGSGDFLWPALAMTCIGIATSWVSSEGELYAPLLTAMAADSLALTLVIVTALRHDTQKTAGMIAIAALWFLSMAVRRTQKWPDLAQAIVAMVIGLGGAAMIAPPAPVAWACVSIAAVAYAMSFRAARPLATALTIAGAAAVGIGFLLVAPALLLVMAWSAAAVLSAGIGRRFSWPAMMIEAALWSVAAAIAAGVSGPNVAVHLFIAGDPRLPHFCLRFPISVACG